MKPGIQMVAHIAESIRKNMYSLPMFQLLRRLWAQLIGKDLPTPLFCFLVACVDLRVLVDRPLIAENNKTDELDKIASTEK